MGDDVAFNIILGYVGLTNKNGINDDDDDDLYLPVLSGDAGGS